MTISTRPLTPDRYERALAAGAVLMVVAVVAALIRGYAHWHEVPVAVWAHLATIIVALILTPIMVLRTRGDRLHRQLGRVWAASLFATAALSFLIRTINHGALSFIHILSAFMLIQIPLIIWAARSGRIAYHRRAVRGTITGALLIAGFFTFPFGRMLGRWLFG